MPQLPDMKTFNDWSYLGYKIKKGSKATWVDDVAMFSSFQVEKVIRHYHPPVNKPKPIPVEKEYQDEPKTIYYADGSGYVEGRGPCGPLYFDYNGNT
jgi:hypothetical protein